MTASRQRPLRAAAAMLGACALIALTTLFAKALGRDVAGEPLHPLQVSAGRFCFAFAALVPLALWRRPGLGGTPWGLHVGRSVCGWLGVSCLFAAAAHMPLSDATAISFLSPLFTLLLAVPLLGERLGAWRIAAAAVAFAGALVLTRPGAGAVQAAALIALAAAALMGLEAILVKRLSVREPMLRILLLNNTLGAAIAGCFAATVWTAPTVAQWLLLATLGVTMLCAQVLFVAANRMADASFVAPFFYSTLVFATLYDLALFGVVPAGASLVGAAFIVSGGLLLAWRERVRRE